MGRMTISRKAMAAVPAVVLLAFLFAVLTSGCGGGDEAQPPAVTKTSTAKTTAKAAAGSSTNKAENMVGQTVTPTDQTPDDFKKSLQERRTIVVNFYLNSPYDDNQVRSFMSNLESKYRGQVDFFKYLNSDGQRYGDLPDILMVNATPTVVVINRQAVVQRAWTGYVDGKSIEQGIVEAMK